jgi:hypothetical protein
MSHLELECKRTNKKKTKEKMMRKTMKRKVLAIPGIGNCRRHTYLLSHGTAAACHTPITQKFTSFHIYINTHCLTQFTIDARIIPGELGS